MLVIFNRVPSLGTAVADYLATEGENHITARENLVIAISEAITNGENPLTMELMILDFLLEWPETGEALSETISSILQERKNILGDYVQLADEFITVMYYLTYDMNHNGNVNANRYSHLVELAKNAPECVRNMAMRTFMNSIVLTGKYKNSEYREALTEAISYAKQIESENESYFEGARCNFWNL